jgi:hypothetical protein
MMSRSLLVLRYITLRNENTHIKCNPGYKVREDSVKMQDSISMPDKLQHKRANNYPPEPLDVSLWRLSLEHLLRLVCP